MASTDRLTERFDELTTHVLAPLVLGGRVDPVRPFGAKLALEIGAGRSISDPDLRSRLDVARVRIARLVAPVDTVADLSAADWALVAGLNDLLQATNHELTGPLTRGRHAKLLACVRELCELVPAPRHIGAALSRHATFARVLECVRTDTTVSWWTGRASFRGQPPPGRLLKWPSIRNVQVDARRVGLTEMATGIPAVDADEYTAALTLWLTRSPLTDIATATRRSPPFAWSASTLAIIATAPGRTLAYRLLGRQGRELALGALERAAREIPERFADARDMASGFAAEVAAGLKGPSADAGRGSSASGDRAGAA
ncbi:MAG: hypothetical protein IT372_39810 [Polyangiaceae bacterium]|nr:hypothetical protein [Polyangiaceae bacterium]